jgi:hypothetical protein
MKYDRKDKTKVIVLAAFLVGLWLFIGVRFFVLSRETKAKMEAEDARRAAAQLAHSPAQGTEVLSPTARLAVLIKPVDPPKSDPFKPVIAPRSRLAAPRAKPRDVSAVLPPLDESASARRREDLRVTGVITGNPSTAVLRVQDQHYVVKPGDWLDERLQVAEIGSNSVTLREGSNTYKLRLGR